MEPSEHQNHETESHLQRYNRRQEPKMVASRIEEESLEHTKTYNPTLNSAAESCLELEKNVKQYVRNKPCKPLAKLRKITPKKIIETDDDAQKRLLKIETPDTKISARKARTRKLQNTQSTDDNRFVDPVIEQWYTDPYNRHDPERSVGRKMRKEVLTTALRNRGFRGGRIVSIVNWLIKCKGRHRAYNEYMKVARLNPRGLVQSRTSKRRRKLEVLKGKELLSGRRSRTSSVVPGNLNREEQKDTRTGTLKSTTLKSTTTASAYPSPISTPDFSDNCRETDRILRIIDCNNHNSDQSDYSGDEASNLNPVTSTAEETAILHQIKEEITGVRPAFHSKHPPGTQEYKDDYDDWRLEDLKRTHAFWTIIYGDDLDEPVPTADPKTVKKAKATSDDDNDDAKSSTRDQHNDNNPTHEEAPGEERERYEPKFTYFRDPDGMPSVDMKFRSQGHKPVSRVVMPDGRIVWTEDDTFGLYIPPRSESAGRRDPKKGLQSHDEIGVVANGRD